MSRQRFHRGDIVDVMWLEGTRYVRREAIVEHDAFTQVAVRFPQKRARVWVFPIDRIYPDVLLPGVI